MNKNDLELIAIKQFSSYEEMYKVVDFLNKSLRDYNLVFGLTENNNIQTISVYREK